MMLVDTRLPAILSDDVSSGNPAVTAEENGFDERR
jgi:hypothetical protein